MAFPKTWLPIIIIGLIPVILIPFLIPVRAMSNSAAIAKTTLQIPPPTATIPPTAEAGEPYPSPDGQWTAWVNRATGSLTLNGPRQSHSIFPDGSGVRAVTWSPDSHRLLVTHPYASVAPRQATEPPPAQPIEIWQIRVKPGNVSQPMRLFQSSREAFERDGVQQVVFGQWSPNRRYVIIWVGILSASVLADGLPVFILDTETGATYPLAVDSSLNQSANRPAPSSTRANTALVNPRYHSWSPDGSKLVITAGGYRSAQINKWLNLVDVATGQVTTAISQAEQIPGIVAWSPQGDRIAYAAIPAAHSGPEWADWMVFDNPAIATRRLYLLDPATGQYRR